MQQELLKTAASAILALLHVAGITILPTATVVAACLVQVACLAGELIEAQAQPSKVGTIHSFSLAERFSGVVNYTLNNLVFLWCIRCGVGILVILGLGASSRLAGLGESPSHVMLLACLCGGAGKFFTVVVALRPGNCSSKIEDAGCMSDLWCTDQDQEDLRAATQWMVEDEPLWAQLSLQHLENTKVSVLVEPFTEDAALLDSLECFADED